MKVKRRLLTLAFATLLALAPLAWAGESVQLYTTGIPPLSMTTGGTENSGVVKTVPSVMVSAWFMNYDAANAKIAMAFDSATLPANGAIPRLAVSIPAHNATGQPGQASFTLPLGGVSFVNGIVWACSILDSQYSCI